MCGCSKRRRQAALAVEEDKLWPGEEGFVALSYHGQAPDERRWTGLETGMWYWFQRGNSKLVDSRDAERFLAQRGETVFGRSAEGDQTEEA